MVLNQPHPWSSLLQYIQMLLLILIFERSQKSRPWIRTSEIRGSSYLRLALKIALRSSSAVNVDRRYYLALPPTGSQYGKPLWVCCLRTTTHKEMELNRHWRLDESGRAGAFTKEKSGQYIWIIGESVADLHLCLIHKEYESVASTDRESLLLSSSCSSSWV